MTRIAAVVLAAGEASRFGAPKQRLLLPHVLAALARAPSVEEVVVVEGAHRLKLPGKGLLQTPPPRLVRCAGWERGPGASLRCGLAPLDRSVEAAVVVLADGPDLAPEAIDRIIEAWRGSNADVVAAGYGGERGHPVLLARPAWERVPDEGARALTPHLVPCDDLGPPGDVDTADDMGRYHDASAEP